MLEEVICRPSSTLIDIKIQVYTIPLMVQLHEECCRLPGHLVQTQSCNKHTYLEDTRADTTNRHIIWLDTNFLVRFGILYVTLWQVILGHVWTLGCKNHRKLSPMWNLSPMILDADISLREEILTLVHKLLQTMATASIIFGMYSLYARRLVMLSLRKLKITLRSQWANSHFLHDRLVLYSIRPLFFKVKVQMYHCSTFKLNRKYSIQYCIIGPKPKITNS